MGCGSSNATRVVSNGAVSVPPSARASQLASPECEVELEKLTDESSDGEEAGISDGDEVKDKTSEVVDVESDEGERENDLPGVPNGLSSHEMDAVNVVYVTYLSTDKKVYYPGEKVFLRAVMLNAHTQRPPLKKAEVQRLVAARPSVSILQPNGCEVAWIIALQETDDCGAWGVQISIPKEAECGTYLAKASYITLPELFCAPAERSFVVRKPGKKQMKLKLEFAKKSYVAGDKVHAILTTRSSVDGDDKMPVPVTVTASVGKEQVYTDATTTVCSRLPIAFLLPSELPACEDVSLVCRVTGNEEVAVVTELVPLPQRVRLSAYPESGYLVVGLQCGLYFQAHNKNEEPLAVTVEVQELREDSDEIQSICTAECVDKHGGYLLFTPRPNRTYRLVIVQCGHLSGLCELPKPRKRGFLLSSKRSLYEGCSPIWLRVGSSHKSSCCLKSFKLGKELSSVDLSFPKIRGNGIPRQNRDGLANWEMYHDVVLSLPSCVSGAVRVAVLSKRGITLAERMIFVKGSRRLTILTDAVWLSSSSSGRKVLDVSVQTLDGKSGTPTCSRLGLTVTKDNDEVTNEEDGIALKLERKGLFPDIHLTGMECLNLTNTLSDNCLEQSLVSEFSISKMWLNCQEVTPEAKNRDTIFSGRCSRTESKVMRKRKRRSFRWTLAHRLSSFCCLIGRTSRKSAHLEKIVHELEKSSTLMIWRAIQIASYDQLKAAVDGTDIKELQSLSWQGETLLHAVARSHSTKNKQRVRNLVKFLLDEAELDVDAHRKGWSDENTPLHLACERGSLVVAEVLIELGATYSLLNGWGVTPLAMAAARGHTDVVQLLLEHDYKTQAVTRTETYFTIGVLHGACSTGWTPLHYAAAGGHVGLIHALKVFSTVRGIAIDFDIRTIDDLSLTPLHCAARYAASNVAAQVIEYLISNGANDLADARGYSYKQLAYLNECEYFGRLSRYGPIQKSIEVKQRHFDLNVVYNGRSTTLTDVASTTTVVTVLRDICQQFGISVPDSSKIPFFLVDENNQCFVDQTVLCAAAVTVVSNDSLCLCRLDGTLQIHLDMTLYQFLSQLIIVNNAEWEGSVLSEHGCVQLSSFLPTTGWSHDPRNLDLQYTPAEYGLQEGDSVYIYSVLIPEEQLPRRLICLSDYVIQECQTRSVELDGEIEERNIVQLKLCPLEITGTFGVVVLKDQPNREPPKPEESSKTSPEDTASQKKGGKQQGKKAPPKEAPPKTAPSKTGGKGRGRGPPGKPLKLKLSSFEPIKTLKELVLSQLGDHLKDEAAIELDSNSCVLTCDIYVNDIFQQDSVPLYASSLYPPSTPAVIKVYPRTILHYSNLTNLFDFWTTPNYIETKLDKTEDLSNSQKAEFMNDNTTECSQEEKPRDIGEAQDLPCEKIASSSHTNQTNEVPNMISVDSMVTTEIEVNMDTQTLIDMTRDTTDVIGNVAEANKERNSDQANCVNNGDIAAESVEIDTNTVVVTMDVKSVEADVAEEAKKYAAHANGDNIDANTQISNAEIPVETINNTVDSVSDVARENQGSAKSTSVEVTASAAAISDQCLETTDDDCKSSDVKQSADEQIEQRRRDHFLAWYERWKTGMLWWGMESLRGHTSYLRWMKTNEVSQMEKTEGLENAVKAVNLLAQEYRDSVDPVTEERHDYADDSFEDESAHNSVDKMEAERDLKDESYEKGKPAAHIPTCDRESGLLDWEAALGHKKGPAVRQGIIIQPCTVWGDRAVRIARSNEPLSSTVYWTAGMNADKSGTAHFTVTADSSVSSYTLKVDAFTASGALGHVQTHISTKNPLYLAWSIPDYLFSGDTLFVPLSLSNCGYEELKVELSYAVEGTTLEVCRLLLNNVIEQKQANRGELGTVSVPRCGFTDFVEIQLGPLTEQMKRMSVTITATAGCYARTLSSTIPLIVVGRWKESFWTSCLERGDAVTAFLHVDDTTITREDTQVELQGYDSAIAIASGSFEFLCSTPSLWLEHAASITFVGTELLQHYMSTGEYSEVESIDRRVNSAMKQLMRCRRSRGGFSRFTGVENKACVKATSFALVMLGHLMRLRKSDTSVVERARHWLMEQLVIQRREKVMSSGEQERHQRRLIRSYALWALTETSHPNEQLSRWMDSAKARVGQLRDPYRLSLNCLALYNYGDTEAGHLAADRLVNWQKDDGRVSGALTTLMTMGETARDVETTSLALLCWLKRGGDSGCPILALRWLIANCNKGNFGSAHCTAIAMKALIAYYNNFGFRAPGHGDNSDDETELEDQKPRQWKVQATLNDRDSETVTVPHLTSHLTRSHTDSTDSNEIAVKLQPTESPENAFLPFCVQYRYRPTTLPELKDDRKLDIAVLLPDSIILKGSTCKLDVTLKSHSKDALDLVICRLCVPAGLDVKRDVLDLLIGDETLLTSYTIKKEAIFLCFQLLPAKIDVNIGIDCIAAHAGCFSASPSCVYMPYDKDSCVWCNGVTLTVAFDDQMRAKMQQKAANAKRKAEEQTAKGASLGGTLSVEGLGDEQHRSSCFF